MSKLDEWVDNNMTLTGRDYKIFCVSGCLS